MSFPKRPHASIGVLMENAAFADRPASELARILRHLATRIERDGIEEADLRDRNGNVVGFFKIDGGAS